MLGERVRARVEDAGRVELGDAEAAALARTKMAHVPPIVLAVLVGVWSGDAQTAALLPLLAFLVAGLAESFMSGVGGTETPKRAGKVFGAWLSGLAGTWVLSVAAG